ncbi:hypothetical protein OBP_214 [Pseudomonas phage OBP]|uniref:hypothetical protein n=1 Tax=Pseudomonas phage OBP TaxID=1124849 RepID=UPI000240D5BA|nr:hypothetical protein OBP_214 [Pseudomonas phage OBP]AEV89651.1 hypothetical protein OBP_214 [Pseudomonas phage OBP]
MKKLILAVCVLATVSAQAAVDPQPTQMCRVEVCNKLERVTLSVSKWISDSMGETCFDITMPKSEAIPGSVLSSESRWYQGSFNPTKKSVTRVSRVLECQ